MSGAPESEGPKKEIIWEGSRKVKPKPGDQVHIHYVGTLADGSTFDSSRARNAMFIIQIGCGKVIKAWDMLVPTMNVGEVAKFTCPPLYAYGARGFPGVIPPNAALMFEVELLGINGDCIKSEWPGELST